jgi:hypothetical protein
LSIKSWQRKASCGEPADDFEEVILPNAENETLERIPVSNHFAF